MKDFVGEEIKESTIQHQEDILISHKGWYKFCPQIGVGIVDYMNETDTADLKYEVLRNFKTDGMKVRKLEITNGKIQLDADYNN